MTILDILERVMVTGGAMTVKNGLHSTRDAITEFKARNPAFFLRGNIRLHAEPSAKGPDWTRVSRQRLIWQEG